jgi:phosphatidylserine decarboxylase
MATYHASVAKELLRPPHNALTGGGLMVRHGSVQVKPGNTLFFTAIYLTSGDYHRFHSLMVWVIKKWCHFQDTYMAYAQSPFSIYGLRILL